MRIGIEAQRIYRKKKHGMDMVALELIRHLQQIDQQNEYFVFVKQDEDNQVLSPSANFNIIEVPGSSYPQWEQVSLPAAARKYNCQLLHCTSNTAPLFTDIPLVVTLHDIIFMEHSIPKLITGEGSNYQKFGNVYRHLLVPKLMKKAKKVITVSAYENKRITEFFGIKQTGLVTTIYNGVSSHFQPVRDQEILAEMKKKYQLPERYFFFLGNTHPKKNTPGVLQAFAGYKQQRADATKLVLIDYDLNELNKQLTTLGIPDLINDIVVLGYVTNKDLPAIYSLCDLFLYPSLRESFGIPIIEAMACGAPAITSNTSSMPEVAGEAAILVDPYQSSDITRAMLEITNNAAKRNQLVQAGFLQAANFTWRQMAEKVSETYQAVIASA